MDTSRNIVWNISSFIDADDDDVDAELEVEAPIESKTHQNMSHFIYTIKKRENWNKNKNCHKPLTTGKWNYASIANYNKIKIEATIQLVLLRLINDSINCFYLTWRSDVKSSYSLLPGRCWDTWRSWCRTWCRHTTTKFKNVGKGNKVVNL